MANGRDRICGHYCFNGFTLDMRRGVLLGVDNQEIPLRPKSFALLLFMLEHAGRLMSRETMMEAVWPNIFVTDDSLSQCVRDVRHALGRESDQLLRTIPGRGYLFNAEVLRLEADALSKPLSSFQTGSPASVDETPRTSRGAISHRLGSEGLVRLSILVLPMRSLYGSDDQAYLAETVTGDVVTYLDRHLTKLAVGQAQILLHTDQLVQWRIQLDHHTDYVLRGGVHTNPRPSVNLQLLSAVNGVCLWAQCCELDRGYDVINKLMFDASKVLVKDVGQRVEALTQSELTPDELVLQGRSLMLRMPLPDCRNQALRCFEQALVLQPDLVLARLGIATLLVSKLANGWSHSPKHDEARAEALLLDASQVDTNIPTVHCLIGILRRLQGRLDEARIELALAMDAAPHSGMAATQLGMTYLYRGQPEVALPYLEAGVHAGAHDFQKPLLLSNLGICLLMLGDVDRAIEVLRESTAADPLHSVPSLILGAALGLRSAPAAPSAAFRRSIELSPSWRTLSAHRSYVGRQADPALMPIYGDTLERGLRRAGMPEK